MKKVIVTVVMIGLFAGVVPLVNAQTLEEVQFQYQAAMNQLIELLLKRIAELQAQVAELLAARANEQMGISTWPRGIEQVAEPYKNVTDAGEILPVVTLEAQSSKHAWCGNSLSCSETVKQNEKKEIPVGITDGRPDQLWISVFVGNPDKSYKPSWTCEKLGNWSGIVGSYDQKWEQVEKPLLGEYRVRCSNGLYTSEDYITITQGKITY